MLSELDLLLDVARRLEEAGLGYMLTGSMALNHYAQPRMTRDIDFVIALLIQDLGTLPRIFGDEFYFRPEAAREAVLNQSCFNVIHNESLIKIDFMIRKREDYRIVEFERRQRIEVAGHPLWIVSKEDLILSKLEAKGNLHAPLLRRNFSTPLTDHRSPGTLYSHHGTGTPLPPICPMVRRRPVLHWLTKRHSLERHKHRSLQLTDFRI
jgi:hypothetical protein